MNLPSKQVEEAVQQLSKLPGIGKKTAMRLTLHLLKQNEEEIEKFSRSILDLKQKVKMCKECHNISDTDVCEICVNPHRDRHTICAVEDVRDVIAVENTSQYRGLYHVLGGLINPLEGIGPEQIQIESLIQRTKNSEVREVIFAFSPNMEGDTTAFYIAKKLSGINVKITTIARGVPVGGELEYADEITLRHSLSARTIYTHTNGN